MKKAISLFASAGIGDIALKHLNYKVLVANELITERANIFQYNYPETLMLNGDIIELKEKLVEIINKMMKHYNSEITSPASLFSQSPHPELQEEHKVTERGIYALYRNEVSPTSPNSVNDFT